MSKIILVAGYTKIKHVQKIRAYFPGEEVVLACAYTRQPKTESKQKYIALFDKLYDLTNTTDLERLETDAPQVACITCTQERDMEVYIQAQRLCNIINEEQKAKYTSVINKHTFKKEMQVSHPELVPDVHLVNQELLEKLDTLNYPLVIKPSGLAGSIMISVVRSPAEFIAHYENFAVRIQEIANEHYLKTVDIIAENYITGPQYSVNVYVNAEGTITFCPIIRIVTPQEMGINDTYSVMQHTTAELADEQKKALEEAVEKVVAYFQIKNTSAHFDSVYHDGQWKFFEVGLRIGGNRQKLFEYSYGMDHFGNDIANRVGRKIQIPEMKRSVCVLQKAALEHGVLQSISYTRNITKEKSPLVSEDKLGKVGAVVGPLSQGGGTITRHYIVGKEHDEVMKLSNELFDSIHFEII